MPDPLGVVSTGHPATTEAAAAVLRQGGNAFDAAVAAGFAATVAEPGLTSLGGGGFMLASTSDGSMALFDFFVSTPGLRRHLSKVPNPEPPRDYEPVTVRFGGKDQVFHAGLATAAAPGVLAGLLAVNMDLGRLDLAQVAAPAAALARDGVALNGPQAHILELLEPILTRTEAARAIFAPRGSILKEGDVFRNENLAAFLSALPGSAVRFYRGDLADRIADDMAAGGGLLTKRDLHAYDPILRDPLTFSYADALVMTNPWPSRGGPLIRATLDLLRISLRAFETSGTGERAVALAAVLSEVDRLREESFPRDGQLAAEAFNSAFERIIVATRGTTHISVVDRDMNVASMTCSNGEGCGYIVPGTGIMLNNMLGEDDVFDIADWKFKPGVRMASMMAPTIVLRPTRGDSVIALGSGGSRRIRSAISQVVSSVLDAEMPLAEAVDRARMHWEDGQLQLEPGLSEPEVAALRDRFDVNLWERKGVFFGGVNAVAWPPDAAADPRRGGNSLIVT